MKRTKETKALRVAALRAFLLVTVSCSVWAVAVCSTALIVYHGLGRIEIKNLFVLKQLSVL